jgi:hypothetical protein
MNRSLTVITLILLLSATVIAADVNGKWKGQMQAGAGRELTFDLKSDGTVLTGTVGGLFQKPVDIKDGKVQGDAVSFWVMSEYQGAPVKLVYKGQLSGNEIKFTMGTEDGSWSTEVVAKRL